MAMTMHVDIVSAEKEIFSGTVEMLIASAEMGEVGILPGHSQMLCRLKAGQIHIKGMNGEEHLIYVSGGILEVQPHVVTILSDTAERAHDLDEVAVKAAKHRAEQLLAKRNGEFEYAKAESELAEAIAQIKIIEKMRQLKI